MKKLLFILMISLPALGIAQGKISSKDSMFCEGQGQSKTEIIDCLLKKQGNTKAPLNSAYNKVINSLGDDDLVARIEASQKEWVRSRNAQCNLEADIYGRESDKYLIEQTCLNYLNKQRTQYLNTIDTSQ